MTQRRSRSFSLPRLFRLTATRASRPPVAPAAERTAPEPDKPSDMPAPPPPETGNPAPPPTRPPEKGPLFSPREHAVPGQEFATLLQVPANLGPDERRAHLLAVRGLMHARQARHEAASAAFAGALALNRQLDLASLPTFWDLPRGGCEAAVNAYLEQGLTAEATTLNARLRHSLRPRLVPSTDQPKLRRAN